MAQLLHDHVNSVVVGGVEREGAQENGRQVDALLQLLHANRVVLLRGLNHLLLPLLVLDGELGVTVGTEHNRRHDEELVVLEVRVVLYMSQRHPSTTRSQHGEKHATTLPVTSPQNAYAVGLQQLVVVALDLGDDGLVQRDHIIDAEEQFDDDLVAVGVHARVRDDRLVRLDDALLVLRVTTHASTHLVAAVVQRLHGELRAQRGGGEGGEGVVQLVHGHHNALHVRRLPHTHLGVGDLDVVVQDLVRVGVVQQTLVHLRVSERASQDQLRDDDEEVADELLLQQRVLRGDLDDGGGLGVLHVDKLTDTAPGTAGSSACA